MQNKKQLKPLAINSNCFNHLFETIPKNNSPDVNIIEDLYIMSENAPSQLPSIIHEEEQGQNEQQDNFPSESLRTLESMFCSIKNIETSLINYDEKINQQSHEITAINVKLDKMIEIISKIPCESQVATNSQAKNLLDVITLPLKSQEDLNRLEENLNNKEFKSQMVNLYSY